MFECSSCSEDSCPDRGDSDWAALPSELPPSDVDGPPESRPEPVVTKTTTRIRRIDDEAAARRMRFALISKVIPAPEAGRALLSFARVRQWVRSGPYRLLRC